MTEQSTRQGAGGIEIAGGNPRKTSDDVGLKTAEQARGLFLRALLSWSGTPVIQSGRRLVGGASPHLRVNQHMHNDSNGNRSDHRGLSQDAVRHQKDALHHKFPIGRQSNEADQKTDQQSQARAQQDSVDMQQIEGRQPEIPKVGSLDAPGG